MRRLVGLLGPIRPRRLVGAAVGVFVAALMAGAAVAVAYGLQTGFDRSAQRADLPDVIARFDFTERSRIDALIGALPNVAAWTTRVEIERVRLSANGHSSRKGALDIVAPGRRGYAIVAGHDLTGADREAVVERGVADQWHLHVGDTLQLGRLGPVRIVGVSVTPDNVAFPLAAAPRVSIDKRWSDRLFGGRRGFTQVDQALVWTRDPARTDITLQQARATANGIDDLRFITRSGVRILIDQAAGIVIALLIAFSLVALGAAGTMLAAGAAADVQRRLPAIGVQRAIGVPRGRVALQHALGAGLVALVAGALGVGLGAGVVAGPSADLLHTLNEQAPGWAVVPWLALTLAILVALAAGSAAWPAWRAAGRSPVGLLRGGDVAPQGERARRRRRRRAARTTGPRAGSFLALGARLAAARRGRAAGAIVALAASGAVVLLMLGLASLVQQLRDDPGSVGKRYQLNARLPQSELGAVKAIPGVAAASPRYVVQAADSYALGEPVKLLAFPGDHTRFEDPPVDQGRRLRTAGEAEIGTGLADALGVRVGGRLAVQLAGGGEARFTVVGTVRSLDQDGRVAYVKPARLLAADPGLTPETVIRLKPGADKASVIRALTDLGAAPSTVGGATTRSGAFVGTLVALLRAVAVLDGLVCLYALVQALGLTARDRRPTLALLRGQGAGAGTILAVLAGAGLVLALPAAVIAIVLERLVLGPLVTRLAAGYADLGGGASTLQSAALAGALAGLAAVAAGLVARRVLGEAPVAGLRGD